MHLRIILSDELMQQLKITEDTTFEVYFENNTLIINSIEDAEISKIKDFN